MLSLTQKINVPADNLKTIKMLVKKTVHELRMPLGAITAGAEAIERTFSALLNGYLLAKEAGLPVEKLRNQQLQLLPETTQAIKRETLLTYQLSNYLLEQLLETEINQEYFSPLSAMQCIKEALQIYPFETIKDKNRIQFNNKNDFMFSGHRNYFLNVLFYLIKQTEKNNVIICIEENGNENIIRLEIANKEIAETRSIDLPFCKTVMESFGGNMIYSNNKNKPTIFKLMFPKM